MQRLWGALTGKSDQWFLTIVLSAVFGKLLLVAMLMIAFFAAGDDAISGPLDGKLDSARFLDVLVLAPLVESILLVFLIWLLGFKLRLPTAITVGLSAVVFVPLHGLTPASISVLPAFLLWGLIQYNWMARGKGEAGFKIVVAAHALANLTSIAAWSLSNSLR